MSEEIKILFGEVSDDSLYAYKRLKRYERALHRHSEAVCNGYYKNEESLIARVALRDPNLACKIKNERVQLAEERIKREVEKVAKFCKSLNLHCFIQDDCRGSMLYVSREPINRHDYAGKLNVVAI